LIHASWANERAVFPQPIEFLTAYISYARNNIHPSITPPAARALSDAYVAMRNLGSNIQAAEKRITATTRQLESMIRLSEAHAKMRLSPVVDESDVAEAVRLIKSAIKASATDARTGLIDMGLLSEGGSASERRRREDLKRAVVQALDHDPGVRSGNAIRYTDLYRAVGEGSSVEIEGAEFNEVVKSLELEGRVIISGEGGRRSVRRVTGL
jgi:DNA replication licensing factor MCM4